MVRKRKEKTTNHRTVQWRRHITSKVRTHDIYGTDKLSFRCRITFNGQCRYYNDDDDNNDEDNDDDDKFNLLKVNT